MTSPIDEIIGRVERSRMTAHVFVAVSKEDTDAIITQLRSLQAERDKAVTDEESTATDRDIWVQVAEERLARAEAAESKLSLLEARLRASEKVVDAARPFFTEPPIFASEFNEPDDE